MAKYKHFDNKQMEFLVVNFKEQLVPGTFEYALNDIIENRIDLSCFENKLNNDYKGASAYHPKILLKAILFAYSKGFLYSRRIEYALKNNIIFMALTGGATPDHSTIASFISSLKDDVLEIFIQVLMICAQLDLIGGEMFALDGCKISSNAAKEHSGTFAELEKKKQKLKRVLIELIEKQQSCDKSQIDKLEKRIDKYDKKIDKITKFLDNNKEKMGTRNKKKKSNITDNESAKMISSHGYIQGYNGLSVVDSKNQVVIYPEAFGSGQEAQLMTDVLDKAKEISNKSGISEDIFKNQKVICDTGYFSEKNCEYLEKNNIDGYIPDQYYRQRNPRFPEKNELRKRKNLYTQDVFHYNEENDYYICPNDKILKSNGKNIKYHEYRGNRYRAKKEDCQNCLKQNQCFKKGSKQRQLFIIKKYPDKTYSEKMINKIDSDKGRDIYSKRMGIVEPVFGNITYQKKMNYFGLRGKNKVNIQWILYNTVHNIEKLVNYGGYYRKRA